MKVLHISWIDSTGVADWTPVDQVGNEIKLTHSVGFLVRETENSIVLALSYDPETESVHCFKHIPIVAIEELREICQISTTTRK